MTEAVEKGNFSLKLETFFNSCILEGWKDSIVSLQTTGRLSEWSENLGIIRRCIDSIVEKILTPPSKVRNFASLSHFQLFLDRKILLLTHILSFSF